MRMHTIISESPMFEGEVSIILQFHENEWCVIKIAPTEAQEDPDEWHYLDYEKALTRYNSAVSSFLPQQ